MVYLTCCMRDTTPKTHATQAWEYEGDAASRLRTVFPEK